MIIKIKTECFNLPKSKYEIGDFFEFGREECGVIISSDSECIDIDISIKNYFYLVEHLSLKNKPKPKIG